MFLYNKEMILKGQVGTKRTNFLKFQGERET